jgi:hypothetical protein
MAEAHPPESISPARQVIGALLLAVFLIGLTWLTAAPNSPALRSQNRDSGMYAYVGMAINRGGDAYVDAWNHKSPGIYYAYGLAFKLLGESRWAIWLAEAVVELLTLAVFYGFVTAWLKNRSLGLLGAACLALISRNPILQENGSFLTEGFALLPQAICLLAGLYFLRKPRWYSAILIGLAGAAAALFKLTTVGVTLAFVPAALLAGHPAARSRERWRWLGLMIGGGLGGLGLAALYLLVKGALFEALDAIFHYTGLWFAWLNGSAGPSIPSALFDSLVTSPFNLVMVQAPLFVPGLIAAASLLIAGRRRTGHGDTTRTVATWLMLSFAADLVLANLNGLTYAHYYITLALSSAGLIVLGLHALTLDGETARHARLAWALILFAAVGELVVLPGVGDRGLRVFYLVVMPVVGVAIFALEPGLSRRARGSLVYAAGSLTLLWFLAMFLRSLPATPAEVAMNWRGAEKRFPLADYVEQHTAPGDRVLFWGSYAALNFQSHRLSPSAFHYAYPLLLPAYSDARVARLVEDLEANQPPLIVDTGFHELVPPLDAQAREEWEHAEDVRTDGGDLTRLFAFVEQHCTLEDEVYDRRIYRCSY